MLAVLKNPLLRNDITPNNPDLMIAEDLTMSNLLKDCMGIPNKIFKLAEALNEKSFRDVELERLKEDERYWREEAAPTILSFNYSYLEPAKPVDEEIDISKTPKPCKKDMNSKKQPKDQVEKKYHKK